MGASVSSVVGSILPAETRILNRRPASSPRKPDDATTGKDALETVKVLEKLMRRVQGEFMSEDGKSVDYSGMKVSSVFADYCAAAAELDQVNLMELEGYQRKALFINLYNLITVHALAELDDSSAAFSSSTVKNFWRTMGYSINGMVFSLDDIEHGILRCNRVHPSKAYFRSTYLDVEDPRRQFSLTTFDPRIHFALNCGAVSCPRISVFSGNSGESLDKSLETAAQSFCAENVVLDLAKNEIALSKIFDWYGSDFGSTKSERLERISSWLLEEEQRTNMRQLIEKNACVRYLPYDWALNRKKK